jgi:hypothetical protein
MHIFGRQKARGIRPADFTHERTGRRRNPATGTGEVHYAAKMPTNLGMILNDQLGCCICATVYRGPGRSGASTPPKRSPKRMRMS